MSVTDSKNDAPTKTLLQEAAVRVFSSKGYQKTRVSDIVAEAGVAQGTFYLYFRSKEAAFREICKDFMDRFSGMLEQNEGLFDGRDADEIRQNLSAFIRRLLAVYRERAEVAELLFREGIGHGGLFKSIYEDIFHHFHRLIRQRIERSLDRRIFRFEDAETAAAFILGLFERSVFYFVFVRSSMDMDLLSRTMTDFILGGLSLNPEALPAVQALP